MSPLFMLILCGLGGAFLFTWFHIPGGAMTGAMVAVILLKLLSPLGTATLSLSLAQVQIPRWVQFCVYTGLGIIVGNMFTPALFSAVRESWWVVLFSTTLTLLAGLLIAALVVKLSHIDATSAYLATSPGGLNVIIGLSAELGSNAPLIMVYQMVRLYAIVFTVPIAAKLLHNMVK